MSCVESSQKREILTSLRTTQKPNTELKANTTFRANIGVKQTGKGQRETRSFPSTSDISQHCCVEATLCHQAKIKDFSKTLSKTKAKRQHNSQQTEPGGCQTE